MFPQGVLECVSEYSVNVLHSYWMKCTKSVIRENKHRVLTLFRHNITDFVNDINGGVTYTVRDADWLKFVGNPSNGLCFRINIDLAWMTCMIDSDDEDDWIGDADAHLDKLGEQAEEAMNELREQLDIEGIKYSIDMHFDSLGGDLIVQYYSACIEQ